ncbi:MAG TPA: ATP-binding protein [Polyangiales bacterium]|nr:ATP-binding protein [Polyangiales bacterium]
MKDRSPESTTQPQNAPERARLSITHKLLALIGLTTGAVVLFLAIYFPAQQIEDSHAALERKAATYGRLVARQVASAIAFDDKETAREIFDAVGQDSDVESLLLLTAAGNTLHVRGAPGSWVSAAKGGVTEQRLLEFPDRIAVVSPVVSAEGPRGTLVVELSTRSLVEREAAVTRTAAIVGVIALLLGMLLAYAIARSLGGRLASIARVAGEVAAGQLQHEPVAVRGHDEIAMLARAFNAMLAQIQALFSQIKQNAEQEQERLGGLVRERTEELDGRNRAMRLVLDNVDQGFLSVDMDGKMAEERSAIIDRWLGTPARDSTLFSYIDGRFPGKGDYMRVAWEALREDWMPLEMRLTQMPGELQHANLHLGFAYQPIFEGDHLTKVLVIVSDMTAMVVKRRAEEEERELVQIVRKLLADHGGFKEYLAEAEELVTAISGKSKNTAARMRSLHTLKGNSAIFGFDSLVRLCHELEGSMQSSGADLTQTDKDRLAAAWERVREKVDGLLKGRNEDTIEIRRVDLARVVANINSGAPASQVSAMIHAWELEPTEARLFRVAEYGRALAERLGKGPVGIRVEGNDVRLDPESWTEFWHSLVHVVRNAIDHGLETSDERARANKPATAQVVLRSMIHNGQLSIQIEDDGRGIDWTRVAAVARKRGLPADTHEQLVLAMFADGMSTRDQASETSGRGVGLSAVREACGRTAGKVVVTSKPGLGSTFEFRWSVDGMGRPVEGSHSGTTLLASLPPSATSMRSPRLVNAG